MNIKYRFTPVLRDSIGYDVIVWMEALCLNTLAWFDSHSHMQLVLQMGHTTLELGVYPCLVKFPKMFHLKKSEDFTNTFGSEMRHMLPPVVVQRKGHISHKQN